MPCIKAFTNTTWICFCGLFNVRMIQYDMLSFKNEWAAFYFVLLVCSVFLFHLVKCSNIVDGMIHLYCDGRTLDFRSLFSNGSQCGFAIPLILSLFLSSFPISSHLLHLPTLQNKNTVLSFLLYRRCHFLFFEFDVSKLRDFVFVIIWNASMHHCLVYKQNAVKLTLKVGQHFSEKGKLSSSTSSFADSFV